MPIRQSSRRRLRTGQPMCSFCGKAQDQVRKLVAGPGVHICNECIDLIDLILDQERQRPSRPIKPPQRAQLAHCSFCGKAQSEVRKLVAGPGVYICDACFRLGQQTLADGAETTAQHPMANDVDALLGQLRQAKATFDQLNETLLPSIGKLREQDISWARIGEALGMSRQAAWERFSGED